MDRSTRDRILEIDVLEGIHVRDRAATGHCRDGVAHERAAHREDARRPRSADQLVR